MAAYSQVFGEDLRAVVRKRMEEEKEKDAELAHR